jgi:type IV pilus biogenesis protein CpaD/CtpE
MKLLPPNKAVMLLAMAMTLASCATPHPQHTAAVAPRLVKAPNPLDEREFDVMSGNFEMPPPYGPRGNRALANY